MAFQETLTGKTSDGYLSAMQTLAGLYEANQQWERSLPLRLQTVEIADLVSRDNDPRRAHVRIEAAQALAARERFDEAERLASEAVTIGESLRPRQSDHFANTLDRIRAMKKDRLRL